uniref:Uncharacterized protein n=1 Tax=Alexandrium monilatum TaxID=311494 RepID=A0A7S4W9X8_9DINO
MGAVYVRAMAVEVMKPPARRPPALGLVSGAYVMVVAFFVFGAQVLGLTDLSAPASPFSSIRVHGGSNHLVLPTGLLQAWAHERAAAASAESSLGGGVVRVEYTDSVWINSLYPSEHTSALPPRVVAVLRQGGHLGRQFNPTPRRVLGPELRALMPRWRPGDGAFPQYTLPALELRRLLAEVRARKENFSLVYVRLPGIRGNDTWRATATGPRVEFTVRGGVEQCASDGRPCSNELVQLRDMDYVAWKTRVFFPHPIVADADGELPCVD